jgi:hypothetical protein
MTDEDDSEDPLESRIAKRPAIDADVKAKAQAGIVMDPDVCAKIAKKHGVTPRSVMARAGSPWPAL